MIGLPAFHSAHSESGSAVMFWIRSSELIASSLMPSNTALVAASARALTVRLSDLGFDLDGGCPRFLAKVFNARTQIGDRQLNHPVIGPPVR